MRSAHSRVGGTTGKPSVTPLANQNSGSADIGSRGVLARTMTHATWQDVTNLVRILCQTVPPPGGRAPILYRVRKSAARGVGLPRCAQQASAYRGRAGDSL